VACDAETGEGCAEGAYCTNFGNCVPKFLACPTDDRGVPLITCTTNSSCGACDPSHQICNTAASTCVACTAEDTSYCQKNESCNADGACVAVCPALCKTDDDCSACSNADQAAYVCTDSECIPKGPTGDGGTEDDGGTGGVCHDVCTAGNAMDASCTACATAVCAADDYCCTTQWDTLCVNEVGENCTFSCGLPQDPCPHPECVTGDPLNSKCSSCAEKICAADKYCCTVAWDSFCIKAIESVCGIQCG
jgi:hypothetical protein